MTKNENNVKDSNNMKPVQKKMKKAMARSEKKKEDLRRSEKVVIGCRTSSIEIWRLFLDYADAEGESGPPSRRNYHMLSLDGFNDFVNSDGEWMNEPRHAKLLDKIEQHNKARFFKYASSGAFTASFSKIYYDLYLDEGDGDQVETTGTILKIVDNRDKPGKDSKNSPAVAKKEDEGDEGNE